MTIETTDILVDGHIVIVQYDQEVVGERRSIVEAFERHSSAHSTVTYEGNDSAIFLLESGGYGHPQCC